MTVVSNTSPLRYLVLIDAVGIVPQVFGDVLIAPAVAAELSHAKTPVVVREWFRSRPDWVRLQVPSKVEPIGRLNPGEVEAIALALEVDAAYLLIDDRAGKKAAQQRGLSAIGTLAVLDRAGRLGLLDFRQSLHDLESNTNFRVSRALRDQLLDDHGDPRASEDTGMGSPIP